MTTDARTVLDKATDEDSLLTTITDALTFLQYVWQHPRRSDKSVLMGNPGLPDIIAARNGIVWFIELKSQSGRLSPDQYTWYHHLPADSYAVRTRVVRPSDLDALLAELVGP